MTFRSKSIRNSLNTASTTILWLIALGLAAFMAFSYSLPQDLTRTTQPYAMLAELSFFGRVLTFHLGLLMALIVLGALLLRRTSLVAFSLLVSALLILPSLKGLLPRDPPGPKGPTLRLMSLNLKYAQTNADLILAQVQKFNPDVLVFQDFSPDAQSALENAFGTDYPHRHLLNNGLQGLAIFSRLPFTGQRPTTSYTKIRRQMRVTISFNGRPIVIYIEHPASPRSRQRILNNRLSTADLAIQLCEEKDPVIVAGDFNFTADTPNEAALKNAGLQDGFDSAGHGRGSTWPADPQWLQYLPGFRIDHIFVGPQLTCTQFFVGDYDGSDHLPIVADIGVIQKSQ